MKKTGRKRSGPGDGRCGKPGRGTAAPPSDGADGAGEAAGDSTVGIPNPGDCVAEVKRIVDSAPDIRTEKVERIRKEVDRGTYRVAGKKVADKMVNDAVQEIRNRTRSR